MKNPVVRNDQPMAYIIDRADEVASMLEKFTNAPAYQVAGQYANIEFWLSETLHALEALADYSKRFDRLFSAQREWIESHNVVIGSYCPMCGGQCELSPGLQPPREPKQIPAGGRNAATQRLKDAFYFFVVRCFRMKLIDEASLRDMCTRVGTSVAACDLVRK